MNLKNKQWEFTEFLGLTDDVEHAIQALKDAHILYGVLSSNEDKGQKRFVQYYECNETVRPLNETEKKIYDEVAVRYHVYIEYAYMEHNCDYFPLNESKQFILKYWEWWMRHR